MVELVRNHSSGNREQSRVGDERGLCFCFQLPQDRFFMFFKDNDNGNSDSDEDDDDGDDDIEHMRCLLVGRLSSGSLASVSRLSVCCRDRHKP